MMNEAICIKMCCKPQHVTSLLVCPILWNCKLITPLKDIILLVSAHITLPRFLSFPTEASSALGSQFALAVLWMLLQRQRRKLMKRRMKRTNSIGSPRLCLSS